MAHDKAKTNLLVMGVHLASEGYPNTLYRLNDLRACEQFHVTEINVPMWRERAQSKKGLAHQAKNILRLLYAHAAVITRFIFTKRADVIYIPYPAVFLLFALSLLPRSFRAPRIVADVFISLYDTIVNDRCLLQPGSLLARILKKIERRAYHYSDIVITDTQQNAKFIGELFGLANEKIKAIALSTDEVNFQGSPYHPRTDFCTVLFIGTMVPLHGIATILEAARLLADRKDIQFKLIGDGQDAHLVETWMQDQHANLSWERTWQTSEMLAQEIIQADICLGIFGAGDKTQRVCPFKIYAYAAIGRAIITGETQWSSNATADFADAIFSLVPVSDAHALANQIVQLATHATLREKLASNSWKFYATSLSNRTAIDTMASLFADKITSEIRIDL